MLNRFDALRPLQLAILGTILCTALSLIIASVCVVNLAFYALRKTTQLVSPALRALRLSR